MAASYSVRRVTRGLRETTVARGIDSLAEAAEVALRLVKLQEAELGGDDEFVAEVER